MFKIKKFGQFLNESADSPETLLKDKLLQIKLKLQKLFDSDKVDNTGDIQKFGQEEEEKESETSDAFKSLNMESLEESQFSKTYQSIKLIFSDDEYRYDVVFKIDLEKAVTQEGQDEPNLESIDSCQVNFKRYSMDDDLELLGEVNKDEVKIDDINEDLFQEMLSDVEKNYPTGKDEDEFEIETEEEETNEE